MNLADRLLETDDRLRDYQVRAVKHLLEHDRAGLFMEMGLGKSFTVLAALQPYHLPVLVVGSKRIAEEVWGPEAAMWRPDLTISVAAGSPVKRKAALASQADIKVIGVDNIQDVPPGKFKTIVLDELSLYKNHNTRRFKVMRKLTKDADYVWGLTGTPSPNGYADLWSQLFLLDRGERLGTTVGRFRERYLFPAMTLKTGTVAKWGLKDGAEEQIQDAIADICLSMRSDDYLELPAVTFNDIDISMPPKAWNAYEEMKAELVTAQEDTDYTAANTAVSLNRLSQITSGFLLPDRDSPGDETWFIHDRRVKAVKDIVESASSPVLVFYQFRAERAWLLKHIKGAKAVDQKGAIAEFMAGDLPVLVAHPASAGHGLNFQHVCHTLVWCSLPWSVEHYLQANARVDRQGQQHPVVIHRIRVPNTVDDAVEDALVAKKSVQDTVLDSLKVSG